MILHLVTDRRRLAPEANDAAATGCLLDQVRYAVAAGLDVIQIRERDLDGRCLAQLTKDIVSLARGSRTRVVVNERLDVALAAGADGVHLRGTAVDAVRVRASVAKDFLVGRSVRSATEAAEAGPVDYLIAGTVWPSASKPDAHEVLGVDGLAQVVAAASVPVLGIGGVELGRVVGLARAGAAGMAAIGAWMGGVGCRAIPLDALTQACRAAFDAANMNNVSPSRDGARKTSR